jgi:uncharacterized membrane protein YqaE (UPF0057 family)
MTRSIAEQRAADARGSRGAFAGTGARRPRYHHMAQTLPTRTFTAMDVLRIVIAIILPPVGVLMQVGFTAQFFINIVLTLLGYIPGIVHAVWIIARR